MKSLAGASKIENHLKSVLANLLIKRGNLNQFELALMKTNVELIEAKSKLSSLTGQSTKHSDLIIEDFLKTQTLNKTLLAKQKFLTKSIAQLKKEILQMEENVLQMDLEEEQLERQVDSLKGTFMVLTKKLNEIRITKSEKTSDIRLISNAIEPQFPIGPNRIKIVFTAMVLGLVLGIAIALSKEHLDNVN